MSIKQNKENAMIIHEHAGKPARAEDTINIARLVSDYYVQILNVNINEQKVCFGTLGHRGSASKVSFNEHHILA